ncbi:MAG: hypothetical protein RIT81_35170 [Deltaproteobacteria bacterium]
MIPFGRIRWVKSVALDEDELAYVGEDPTVRHREPSRRGDVFDLHCTEEDADTLAEPEVDDRIVLVQHGLTTHLVRVVGEHVERRPKSTIRRGTRDHRFVMQRTCVVDLLCAIEPPTNEAAFGFEPRARGGEVFAIRELEAYAASREPMWAVQRRIVQALTRASDKRRKPKEEPMRRIEDDGKGRVER